TPEHRNRCELLLGHEPVVRQHAGKAEDLVPAHVIGHVHACVIGRADVLGIAHRKANRRCPQHHSGPDARRAAQKAVRRNVHTEERQYDNGNAEHDGHEDHRGIDNQSTHAHEKWSNPPPGATRAPCSVATTSPSPASAHPIAVSGSSNRRSNSAASMSRGDATSNSYSSPLRAAASGSSPPNV